ncbi:glycosyltransferase [uncultured Desulfuromusa sp.]|uniref:glycosyltransferase n=1 Tax=uncultured Desulfuromusa sp. TaxID=219183 RepID=UPI002AA8D0F5|nr:glycosyltransferase [uncultured Desulfuromusa sp.]
MSSLNDKVKVAQILAGAEQGGAENFFVRLVSGLQASGRYSQHAFLRNHQHRIDSLRQNGVSAQGFRFGSSVHFLDHQRYLKALKDCDPEIVMTWMNRASKATPKGNYRLVSRLGHYYDLKYYRHADYWVGISKGICDHLIKGGMPASKVIHIPNFADETEVSPLPRNSFDTPVDRPLLLAAGRLHVNKGFDVLLRALVEIPDACLWLAGSGPEEKSLKQQCDDLNLNDRVRFLGWRTDVTALMRTADLFVCPSRHEGLGSIVMESWFHDCPIIATNSQGPGEVIEDGETGLLTPVDQVESLVTGIKRLLEDGEGIKRLTKNAKAHYHQFYCKDVIVKMYESFYSEIL